MPPENATAIVLRTIEFSETSLVVSLFTREHGKLGVLAKGARRLKGPFESALDLLAVCRIVFLRKSSEALDLLTEAKLLRRFRMDSRSLAGLYGGYYVAELLSELTHEYDPHPELFDLADQTLVRLAEGVAVARDVLRFELHLLRHLGLLPSLEQCVGCGCDVPAGGRVAFGHWDGGVLCPKCRPGKRQVASVRSDVLRTMVQLAESGEPSTEPMDNRTRGELRGLMNHYFAHLLGKKPKMQAYLGWDQT
ncbi:MAG: DNA repair protein RecO [Pirellulales bacterium]|nr:DNA repair protein RecO [Pirellulales bacterium]